MTMPTVESATSQAWFIEEPYCRKHQSEIIGIEGEWVMFQSTIFYPLGGGQPGDVGAFSQGDLHFKITDTRKGDINGQIIHQVRAVADDHSLDQLCIGATVDMTLDWQRRYRLMRMHTALHLLCSAVPKGVTGGSIGAMKSRLDFDLGEHSIDKVTLTEQLNRLVDADYPVSQHWITDEQLQADPALVRTMSVKPPQGAGRVRMVNIEGLDLQPCGGTHVRHTAEIGGVRVSKIENKGRRNRRVHIVFTEDE